MRLIESVLNAARRRVATKAPLAPIPTIAETLEPQCHLPALEPLENTTLTLSTYTHFVRSPLVGETNPTTADVMVALHRNCTVQRSAAAYKLKLEQLMEVACYRGAIARAISVARECDLCLSPEVIAETIDSMSASLDDEIEAAVADKADHDLAEKSAMARHLPLKAAVSKRLDQLFSERAALLQADDAERRANRIGLTGYSRFSELRKAGLSDSDIAKVLPGAANPESVAAHRRERVAKLAGEIEKLRAFSSSATYDAELLAGLEGFSELISARDGEKVAA